MTGYLQEVFIHEAAGSMAYSRTGELVRELLDSHTIVSADTLLQVFTTQVFEVTHQQ